MHSSCSHQSNFLLSTADIQMECGFCMCVGGGGEGGGEHWLVGCAHVSVCVEHGLCMCVGGGGG